MFSINLYNKLEPLSVYVVKPTGDILGCLDDEINESTGSLTVGLNQQYELSFEIHKTDDSMWFDYLQEGMYLLVDKIGLFKMRQPEMVLNGFDDTKTISAFSCDVELEDKNCEISINMGTKVSQEYLISDSSCDKEGYLSYTDSNGNTQYELIKNPYTNLPYDWIYLHNVIPAQLGEFKTKYTRGDYGETVASTKRAITDSTQIAEFQSYVDIAPRLKHKFTVTNNDYSLVEFLSYTYTDGVVTQIFIDNDNAFKQRIADMKLFYEKYQKQLSLLDIVLEEMGGDWTVGDIYGEGTVQDSADKYALSNKKFQFEISENIYSFLTQTLASTIECVVNFDIINRKVNVTPVAQIGKDTGIVMSYDNLINSMNVTCEEENLSTRLFPKGANDLTIGRANYGQEYVVDLSYKMNAKDKDDNLLYVDSELASKYETYINYLEAHRAEYIQYSKDIDRLNKEINEIKYRVPADDLKTDWGTFKKEELEANLTAYKNLLNTLKSLYKEDFGTAGCNPDGSINESYIKNTFYWYDYKAYKNIIDEIECAIATFPYYSDQDKWTDANTTAYKNKIKAWETEWSLYGTVELKNKIDIYKGNMDLLAEKSVIRLDATAEKTALDAAKADYEQNKGSMTEVQKQAALANIATLERAYNIKYYSIKTWGNLSTEEKESYGGTSANYYYDKYMEYYNYFIGTIYLSVDNPTGNPSTSGYYELINGSYVISTDTSVVSGKTYYYSPINAYDYLVELNEQIDTLTTEMDATTATRAELNKQATLSGFTNGGVAQYFTDNEIKVITRLYRDADYSNENILTTNISTTDEVIDTCLELLEDAKDHISISSRPQLTFAVEADNILGLPEYKAMWADFKSGNYMMVQYRDDTYVKLRIVAFTFNPFLPTSKDFKIEFSNFTRSRVLIADTSSILGLASATSSRSSSSGGSSGSGAFGESDDIDITISNTMLAKLLSSETFGTRVTNVILDTLDVNALTAKKASFGDVNARLQVKDNEIRGYVADTYETKSDATTKANNLHSEIVQSGYSIRTTVATAQNKYNLEDYDITLFGYGDPDNTFLPANTHPNELYLNQNNGEVWKSQSGSWVRLKDNNNQNITLKTNKEYLGSQITQTASEIRGEVADVQSGLESTITQTANSIKLTVADAQDKYDESPLESYGYSISLRGFGHPSDDTKIPASPHPNELYLNQNNGEVWKSQSGSWVRFHFMNQDIALKKYSSQIAINKSNISLKVSKDSIISEINATPESITIDTEKLNLNGYVTVTGLGANGTTEIDGSRIKTGSIKSHNYSYNSTTGVETGSILILQDSTDSSKDGTFSFGSGKLKWDGSTLSVNGTITAGSGSVIGGWTIGANKIYNNDLTNGLKTAVMQKPTSSTTYVFAAGGSNNSDYSDCPFKVTKMGKLYATDVSITGAIIANSGRIGHWDIDNNGTYLKGTSLDSEEVNYICTLTKKKLAYGWGEYEDKFGFTVHNSSSNPYFQYYVRQVSFSGGTGYMLMEEALNQGIGSTSGAVDTIRVYRSQYQGSEILIGKVISTNHSSDLPKDSYCVIEVQAGTNTYKGQVRPITQVISGGIISVVMNSMTSFDDDLGDGGNFNTPLYERAYSNDGINVYIPDKGNNVLLSYEMESVVSGYTYLTSQSLTNSFVPILAIDVKLNSNAPDFSTAKTVLYNNGVIKTIDIKCNSISSDTITSNEVETLTTIANKFVSGNGGEFTITDSNYTNITLKTYIENILRTHRLIA